MLSYLSTTSTVAAHPTDWGKVSVIVAIIIFVAGVLVSVGVYLHRLTSVEDVIKDEIKPELKNLKKSIDSAKTDLGGRIDKVHEILHSIKSDFLSQSGVTEGQSPRTLTPEGQRILTESGVKEIVDSKLGDIISQVQTRKPINEYQVEQYVIEAVNSLRNDSSLRSQLEEGAFNSGSTLDIVLYVGAIYIRDQVLAAINLPKTNE